MSILKWTLAMAGTAIGMRYLSDRHRRRIAFDGQLAPRTDRDGARGMGNSSRSTWAPQDSTGGSGLGSGTSGASTTSSDGLASPGASTPGGATAPRF